MAETTSSSNGPGPSCWTPGLSVLERTCCPPWPSLWLEHLGVWTTHISRLDKQPPPAPSRMAGVRGQPGHRGPEWTRCSSAARGCPTHRGPERTRCSSVAWGCPTPTPPPAGKAPMPSPQTHHRSAPRSWSCCPRPAPWSAAPPASRAHSPPAALAEQDAARPPVPSGLSHAPRGVPRASPARGTWAPGAELSVDPAEQTPTSRRELSTDVGPPGEPGRSRSPNRPRLEPPARVQPSVSRHPAQTPGPHTGSDAPPRTAGPPEGPC